MSEKITVQQAKTIMGENFIGPDELKKINFLETIDSESVPDVPFDDEYLKKRKDDYLLILGIGRFADGKKVTIRNLQQILGKDPEEKEPCFYNQDWYDNESFIDVSIRDEWFLIRKNVYEDSRAIQPIELVKKYKFPSAICCTYAFFMAWLALGIKLWCHDFVWCRDTDHNGDRIYVGKYYDVDGINKNGFSIHRHLSLRTCYACID